MKLSAKIINLKYIFIYLTLILLNVSFVFAQEENLNVLDRWIEWSDSDNMLIHHLNKQAFGYLDIRNEEIANLKTKADWLKRQNKVKEILMKIIGPFPEKTPLRPRVTGVIRKDGYKIEKIIYESMPKFYVTACLFIPDGIYGKTPVVVYVSGHSDIAFRSEPYQILIHNLARKGFIVFAIDPVGQGERLQYYDPEQQKSSVGGPTSEHSYVGNQCFLSGISVAKYFIWDIIRGIDYLLTRDEVDPERIGITGRSGGGTQTTYAAAFDERIKAAAPECYVTTAQRLYESIGAQDAEQNFYHAISNGIALQDLIEVRAPKHTMLVTTTRDFFSIQGARETYNEAMNIYKAFGKKENLRMVEDDNIHASTRKNREAVYAYFQETLGLPGNPVEENVEILQPEELYVTTTGQLSTSLQGETVFSINKKETEKLSGKLEVSRKNIRKHITAVKQKAKELSGYMTPYDECESVFRGRYQRDGYSVEMYALNGEGDYVIPLLLMVPDKIKKRVPTVIYIHPEGKAAEASAGGGIEVLVKKGFIVAVPDVIGIGETKGKPNNSGNPGYSALLIGRSIVGIQAGDIVRITNMLKSRSDVIADRIGAVAFDEMCPALLHAAAFEPSINSISLIGSPISYREIVTNKLYNYSRTFKWAVAGALTGYDLPDLVGCVAPRKVILFELKDHIKERASSELINKELDFPRSVYNSKNASENLKVLDYDSYYDFDSVLDWWIKE